jgi:hypothetical protein
MMSLFSDIASSIGHTVDSLAVAVGADVNLLETVINDLDDNGVDVFSFASRLGLSVEGFLSGIINLMRGDPHQLLLQRLTGPARPMDNALSQLAQQWAQVAYLHQGTAQAIDAHINELFQDSGSDSYSGMAADTLLRKHQDYQKYFTVLVEHAQTQHIIHATLGNQVNEYLSQAPGNVSRLSTPMAALSLLSLDTATDTPPSSVLDDPAVQGMDQAINWDLTTGEQLEQSDPDPTEVTEFSIAVVMLIVLVVLAIVWVLVVIVSALHDALTGYQSQQKNALPTPTPPPGVGPGPGVHNSLTPQQQHLHNDVASRLAGVTYDSREIDDLIRAGYVDPDAIAAIIKGGRGTFAVFNVSTIAKTMNGLAPSVQLVIIAQAIANKQSKAQIESILNSITQTKSVANSEGSSFTYANSHETVTAHTIQEHVGKTDDYLKERVSKGKSTGGEKFASTFPDESTAQSGVDMVIAKSAKLQDLIKAAVPGTAKTDKNCNPPVSYGRGFQKNVTLQGPPPTYGPPTAYTDLNCVTVTIGIGSNGTPFVITAYPST